MTKIKLNKDKASVEKREAELRTALNILNDKVIFEKNPQTLIKQVDLEKIDLDLALQSLPTNDEKQVLRRIQEGIRLTYDEAKYDDNTLRKCCLIDYYQEYGSLFSEETFYFALNNLRKMGECMPHNKSTEVEKDKLNLLHSKLIEYSSDLTHCGLMDVLKPETKSSNTIEFKNESQLDFTDISSEEYRIYEFNNGKTVMISEPLKLNVAKSGGHRIFDSSGISHYIPQGWIRLSWKAKAGQPNFVK